MNPCAKAITLMAVGLVLVPVTLAFAFVSYAAIITVTLQGPRLVLITVTAACTSGTWAVGLLSLSCLMHGLAQWRRCRTDPP